jgi:hypothetical protein
MDTRFWGPSGWKLLHLATFMYEPSKQKSKMRKFLATLPFILPCKFCRASLTDYYKKHSYTQALESRTKLTRWLYDIHNEVNAKLRSQGILTTPDPSFTQVKDYYTTWINTTLPAERQQVMWIFLFSVAYCHPADTSKTSKPMPDCPSIAFKCKSVKIKNKWNTLRAKQRLPYYKQFWRLLPDILEPDTQINWKKALETTRPSITCRKSTLAWLWRMRCAMDHGFTDPYTSVCQSIKSYSSDCSSSVRAKTCRKKRT